MLDFLYNCMRYLQNEPRINYQSKFVFKLSASGIDTKTKSLTPFTNCFTNNALIKFIPGLQNASTQIFHIADLRPVDSFLHDASYLIVYRFEVRAVWRP